jgi:hypothetical protein
MVRTKEGGRVISDSKAFKGGMIVYHQLDPVDGCQGILYDLSADPLCPSCAIEGPRFAPRLQRDHVGMSKGMKRETTRAHYSTASSACNRTLMNSGTYGDTLLEVYVILLLPQDYHQRRYRGGRTEFPLFIFIARIVWI